MVISFLNLFVVYVGVKEYIVLYWIRLERHYCYLYQLNIFTKYEVYIVLPNLKLLEVHLKWYIE